MSSANNHAKAGGGCFPKLHAKVSRPPKEGVIFPATLYQQLQRVVLHEVRQSREEQGRVCAVNVAVVARDGHRHLLHRTEAAKKKKNDDEKEAFKLINKARAKPKGSVPMVGREGGTGDRREKVSDDPSATGRGWLWLSSSHQFMARHHHHHHHTYLQQKRQQQRRQRANQGEHSSQAILSAYLPSSFCTTVGRDPPMARIAPILLGRIAAKSLTPASHPKHGGGGREVSKIGETGEWFGLSL